MSIRKGGYTGASKRRTFGKGWNPTDGSSDVADLLHLPDLRKRSYDLYRNTPIAHGVIDICTLSLWDLKHYVSYTLLIDR